MPPPNRGSPGAVVCSYPEPKPRHLFWAWSSRPHSKLIIQTNQMMANITEIPLGSHAQASRLPPRMGPGVWTGGNRQGPRLSPDGGPAWRPPPRGPRSRQGSAPGRAGRARQHPRPHYVKSPGQLHPPWAPLSTAGPRGQSEAGTPVPATQVADHGSAQGCTPGAEGRARQ